MNYNDLKNNVSKLSISQLNNLLIELNNGFISEHKYECIKLILCEIEYRRLSKFIDDPVDLKIIVDYNYDILWKIEDNIIKKSISFMKKKKIEFIGILRWLPIFLDMNRVYDIYKELISKNYSNDKIFDFLIQDIRYLLNFKIVDSNNYDNDQDFVKFILDIVTLVNDKRKSTDIYKRMIKKVIDENSYALNHLK